MTSACLWLLACVASFGFFLPPVTAAVNYTSCLACSYTFAGHDGVVDRECVSNATYFDKTHHVPCNFTTHYCTITVVYEQDYSRLLSLSRSCLPPQGNTENRCVGGIRPECKKYCRTDRCNDGNGDLRAVWTTSTDGNGVVFLSINKMALAFVLATVVLFVTFYA